MSVKSFEIRLDRECGKFYGGDLVRGVIKLVTVGDITTRAVRIRFEGKGRSYFSVANGKNRNYYGGKKFYEAYRYTLFGNYHDTNYVYTMDNSAKYGTAGGNGVMYIPCEENENLELIIRVMDHDDGRRDEVLGEIGLDASALARLGAARSYPLRRKGKPEQGEVTLSAKIFTMHTLLYSATSSVTTGSRVYSSICELRVHQATGLRSTSFIRKNYVYVQAYRSPAGNTVDTSGALPEPDWNAVLPGGTVEFPFAFHLRADAPGSVELPSGRDVDKAYIRYILHAHIEKTWRSNPSVERVVTVIASRPLPPPSLLYPIEFLSNAPVRVSSCACFFLCTRVGTVSQEIRLPRQVFASHELLPVALRVVNDTSSTLIVKIKLKCKARLTSSDRTRTQIVFSTLRTLHTATIAPRDGNWTFNGAQIGLRVPAVHPTFVGSLGTVNCYTTYGMDPVVFAYTLMVQVKPRGMCGTRCIAGIPL